MMYFYLSVNITDVSFSFLQMAYHIFTITNWHLTTELIAWECQNTESWNIWGKNDTISYLSKIFVFLLSIFSWASLWLRTFIVIFLIQLGQTLIVLFGISTPRCYVTYQNNKSTIFLQWNVISKRILHGKIVDWFCHCEINFFATCHFFPLYSVFSELKKWNKKEN